MAVVAHWLHTPLNVLDDMAAEELLDWTQEAVRLARESTPRRR